jgi:hypothetical protein
MVTKEQFLTQYNIASAKQRYLFDDTAGDILLSQIAEKFHITDPAAKKHFFSTVSDIILGFYRIEDTVPLLQQELKTDAKTAALMGAEVLDYLAPLSDPNFVIPAEIPDLPLADISTHTPELIAIPQSIPVNTYAVPAATPIPATPVIAPELHTMAMDANDARSNYQPTAEPVYSSEQPVIRQPLSDLPSYTNGAAQPQNSTPVPPIEPPRWGV